MVRSALRGAALGAFVLAAGPAFACSVAHVSDGRELLAGADYVVRAKAIRYIVTPADPRIWTTGTPDSVVEFQVEEVVRGAALSDVALHGYLTQRDDFNDQKVPYTFVRPGGRGGSCFANSYREGAEYLLFLKKAGSAGELTVNWAALSPVNEELHNADDPWLVWVREQPRPLQK